MPTAAPRTPRSEDSGGHSCRWHGHVSPVGTRDFGPRAKGPIPPAGGRGRMDSGGMGTGQQLDVLGREQCLDLLDTARVGRLVFIENALPAVQPVNFRLYLGQVVIRVAG